MSQAAFLASPAIGLTALPAGKAGSRQQAASSLFRCQDESLCALSWLVAVAGTFLIIGIVGMLRFEVPLAITLSGAAGMGASEIASEDTTMAELQAMEESPEVVAQEMEVQEVIEVPEMVEATPDVLEMPELVDLMDVKDVFTVPARPVIETALKPVDPVAPKPKPQPKPAVAQQRSTPATTKAAGTAGGTQGSGGGGGGNGAVGSGGKGRFPAPPYPSFARSRGIRGTVTLTIRVNPSGGVDGVSVASSTGFSDLDNYAATWVRNNWRFPTGTARSYRLPISFKLR